MIAAYQIGSLTCCVSQAGDMVREAGCAQEHKVLPDGVSLALAEILPNLTISIDLNMTLHDSISSRSKSETPQA